MLSACAASQDKEPVRGADPVIERVTETVAICPAELRQPLPAKPVPGAEAALTGSAAGMAWLEEMLAWAGVVELRLVDAAKECKPA